MLSIDKLKKYIKSESDYKKAIDLYEKNCVSITRRSSFWKSDININGSISDENIQYSSAITLSGEDITSYRCNCATFNNYKRICSHIGATYLETLREEDNKEKLIYTSIETRKTVNEYLNRNINRSSEQTAKVVSIYVETVLVKGHLEARFYLLKQDKKYKIRNLFEFYRLFEEQGVYQYGRNFKLVHTIQNFNEISVMLIEFIITNIRNEILLCNVSGHSHMLINDNSKLVLLGENIDKFFSILKENNIPFICNHKAYNIHLKTPEVLIKVAEHSSGFKVTINNIMGYLEGNSTLYLFDDKNIYKVDRDFFTEMKIFIENIFANEENTFSINKNDMASFCNGVIPILLEFCNIDMPDKLLERYKPWELKCRFILNNKEDKIYLNLETKYKDEDFNIFKGICNNKNVCRDYNLEYMIKNIISQYHFINTVSGDMMISEYEHIYEFLKHGIKKLQAFGEVVMSEDLLHMRLIDKMKIGAKVSVNSNWLNLQIDAEGYTKKELELLINSYREKKKYIRFNENTIVKLDGNDFELLAGMAYDLDFTAEDLINNNIFIPRYRALYIDSRLSGKVSLYSKDKEFKSLIRTIKQVEDSEISVPDTFGKILRDYQKIGFRWLKTMDICGFGGILADDMGLGKTVQILALLADEYIINKNKKKSLIIVPASLIFNWENEVYKFAENLKIAPVVGAKSERVGIIHNSKADIFITSYDLLKRDVEEYSLIEFRYEILDEAQNIKNYTTNNARAVKKIKAETRFALTGTPIENRLGELWSIFDFVMPGFLYTNKKFRNKFELPIVKDNQTEAVNGLKRMISPFILRREKSNVLKELPEKMEYNLFAKMEGEQQKLYTANIVKLKEELRKHDNSMFESNKIRFLAELTKLRQICCDPSLCYEDYEDESSKLELCIDLIKNSIEGGHKILLFSQFTSMLGIISDRLIKENISFYSMTGATNREDRMTMVNKFNKDNTSVFLISLRVGGTGINLTSADIVIHYDPWWNVAVQNQATDRAHRIGQEKVVSVFKLITKNSVEENILTLQQAKEGLSSDIINGKNISLSNLSKDELLSILNG